MLLPLSKRLYAARTFEEAIDTILDDTIALLGAEYGNVQLPIGDALAIVAQRGLSARFLSGLLAGEQERRLRLWPCAPAPKNGGSE